MAVGKNITRKKGKWESISSSLNNIGRNMLRDENFGEEIEINKMGIRKNIKYFLKASNSP